MNLKSSKWGLPKQKNYSTRDDLEQLAYRQLILDTEHLKRVFVFGKKSAGILNIAPFWKWLSKVIEVKEEHLLIRYLSASYTSNIYNLHVWCTKMFRLPYSSKQESEQEYAACE